MSLTEYSIMEMAYWDWVKAHCPHHPALEPDEERRWRQENPFPYGGKLWRRVTLPDGSISDLYVFQAEDGIVIRHPRS